MVSKLHDGLASQLSQINVNSTQIPLQIDKSFLSRIVQWSWIILIIASIFQCIIFGSLDNCLAVGCVILSWMISTIYFLRPDTLKNYPLSTFLILGFVTTNFYFALIFTLLEGKPVVYNLVLPLDVFYHSTLALVVLTTSHILYRIFLKNSIIKVSSFLNNANFFSAPNDLQLWIMGIVGLVATYYVYMYSPSIGWSPTGAASDKAVQALIPFMYAPYFIPFSRLYGKNKLQSKSLVFALIVFTIFVFLVSIARNSRASFMVGFTSVGFAYSLGLILNHFEPPKFFTLRNMCICIGGFWFLNGPVADIGTAMVIVRDQRHDIPYDELIQLTLETSTDKETIRLRRLVDVTEKHNWDEIYMDNIFIQRFSNLKFNDASLVLASKFGEHDPDMLNFTIDHFLATLPLPIIEFLELKLDKNLVTSSSYGDYFHYLVSGDPYSLKGFRTGHFAGTGMAAFGWWYLLILGVGMIPIFLLHDVFCIKQIKMIGLNSYGSNVQFSFCGLLMLTSVFQFLSPAESVENIASFILRGWIQTLVLYFIVYHFSRLLSNVVYGRTRL